MTVLEQTLAALRATGEVVADTLEGLTGLVGAIAKDAIDALTIDSLLGASVDDRARALVRFLSSVPAGNNNLLAHLPLRAKQQLLLDLVPGSAGDEDEAAINLVMQATHQFDLADYFQLVHAVGHGTFRGSARRRRVGSVPLHRAIAVAPLLQREPERHELRNC